MSRRFSFHKYFTIFLFIIIIIIIIAGHCYRHPELSTQKLVLWEPTHGHRGRGRPNITYIDTLKRDTGAFEACEIAALMTDKRLWKDLVVARLRATKY